jgi:hypothetical protein
MKTIYSCALLFLSVTVARSALAQPLVNATFPANQIKRVILRASAAEQATVSYPARLTKRISISGVPSGSAKGYRSPDPDWKETPASEWGLGFVAKQYGDALVISSRNEMQYIHHRYTLESLRIELPAGVVLVSEGRVLDGDGKANLSSP